MFFNKKKKAENPFEGFDLKEAVYYDFFKEGFQSGLEMYIASKESEYLKDLSFKNPLYFDGKKFKKIRKTIVADAIYDRSGGLKFPSMEISKKTLNSLKFKILCWDKNKMYTELKEFMPKSFKIKTQASFHDGLKNFSNKEMIVLKPAKGLGGRGIIIDYAPNILKLNPTITEEMTMQRFVDTSYGIEKIVKGIHDLRIVVVDGEIIYAIVRKPAKGSYLANVAQGGSIKEVSLDKIPAEILATVKKIQKILDKKYSFPIYSIDFGIEKKKPFVFELNDQIGFPSKKMKSYNLFNKALIRRLIKICNI